MLGRYRRPHMAATTQAPAARSSADRSAPTIAHIPALDGLRGAAVLAVLAFHGGYLDGGYLGVDLFFVLSGYLITALLLAETGRTGAVGLAQFWARRCRRLLPALFSVLVVTMLASRWLADPLQWRAIRDDGLATVTYVANWHTIFIGQGYGAGTGGQSPFAHTWSLAIEEQFYLVWPLLVAWIASRGRDTPRSVLRLSVAVAGVSAGLGLVLNVAGVSPGALYLGTHTRIAAVAIGATIAAYQVDRRRRGAPAPSRMISDTAGYGGISLLIVAWALMGLDSSLLFRGGLFACSLGAGLVVWAISESPSRGPSALFGSRGLREVGLRSYGLYLWHWPIFVWLDGPRTGLDGVALFALRVLVSGAVACVSYVVIEQPIRHLRISPRDTFVASGIGVLVVAIVAAACAIGAPPPLLSQGRGPAMTLDEHAAGGIQLGMFGDSVAENLASSGIWPLREQLGVSVRDGGVWGCQLIAGVGPVRNGFGEVLPTDKANDCAREFGSAVAGLDPPADVLVAFFGGMPYEAKIDGRWRDPCSDVYLERYRERAAAAIEQLGSTGKPVTIVVPEETAPPIVQRTFGIADAPRRRACTADVLREVAASAGVGVVDLAKECAADGCGGAGRDLRRDGVHYEGPGARVLARWLVPLLISRARMPK